VPAVSGEAAERLNAARDEFAGYEKQAQGTLERAGALASAERAAPSRRRGRPGAQSLAAPPAAATGRFSGTGPR
jgi:hypothetical protein